MAASQSRKSRLRHYRIDPVLPDAWQRGGTKIGPYQLSAR